MAVPAATGKHMTDKIEFSNSLAGPISEAASAVKRRGGRPPASADARARLAAETPEEAELRRARQREAMVGEQPREGGGSEKAG
jgi:hypothetical protein